MTHSDFEIVRVESDRIFIVDLDLGNRSVTNDAEYVYDLLSKNFPNKRIIYRDSMRSWSEIVVIPKTLRVGNKNKYDLFSHKQIDFIPYNQHIPDDSEITGCPSSAFFDKPKKILNNFPEKVVSKLYHEYYKNYGK